MFKDFTSGLAACREIAQNIKPSIMRLFDEAETVSIIKKVIGMERQGAFMNLAVEGMKEVVDIEMRSIFKICKKYGAEDMGAEYGEKS